MFRKKITLDQALALEKEGKLLIIDISKESLDSVLPNLNQVWKINYDQLRTKAPFVPADKLLSFFSATYVIEIPYIFSEEPLIQAWAYLYGLEKSGKNLLDLPSAEFIYILVNSGYPELIKIGITTRDVPGRAKEVSSTGTVYEWEPKYALPVKKGTAYRVEQEVHKIFNLDRVATNLGSSREFFKVNPIIAFDKIREIAKEYTVGDPIGY